MKASSARIARTSWHLAFLSLFALCTATMGGDAWAEKTEIRISHQFGLPYLPIFAALDQDLIEKKAKAMGLQGVQVSGVQLGGTSITNDALLSGSIDFAVAGMGGVLQMWDKTNGRVKAVMSLNNMALLLNTSEPGIKNLKDYLGITGHKIAMPAVKVSAHAIILEMAAERAFGMGKQFVLDSLTVSMPHPLAYAALMSGHSEVRSHFANMPFSYFELHTKDKGIHTVISSYDVMGGAHSNVLLYATKDWVDDNPKLLKAVFDSIVEADNWINANPGEAAKLFKRYTKSKFQLNDIEAMVRDKSQNEYAPEPKSTMKFAQFMHKVGLIKKEPRGWKEYFWDISHRMNGS